MILLVILFVFLIFPVPALPPVAIMVQCIEEVAAHTEVDEREGNGEPQGHVKIAIDGFGNDADSRTVSAATYLRLPADGRHAGRAVEPTAVRACHHARQYGDILPATTRRRQLLQLRHQQRRGTRGGE